MKEKIKFNFSDHLKIILKKIPTTHDRNQAVNMNEYLEKRKIEMEIVKVDRFPDGNLLKSELLVYLVFPLLIKLLLSIKEPRGLIKIARFSLPGSGAVFSLLSLNNEIRKRNLKILCFAGTAQQPG